jgi:hypothetical protein
MAQRRAPYRVETVRGTEIRASGRTLVPVARIVSATSHRATVRQHAVEARGAGIARVRPLHLIELQGDHGVVLPIEDLTARTIAAMLLAAAAVAFVSLVLIVMNRFAASSRRAD